MPTAAPGAVMMMVMSCHRNGMNHTITLRGHFPKLHRCLLQQSMQARLCCRQMMVQLCLQRLRGMMS